jgi:hypothetical protein
MDRTGWTFVILCAAFFLCAAAMGVVSAIGNGSVP